mmetsp:Transcript_18610/g.29686  ORF Transcript_18610/g.29686 Transcript_18610/m.29686 type:complete len:221 (-) Transcript_18610:51-713(-)
MTQSRSASQFQLLQLASWVASPTAGLPQEDAAAAILRWRQRRPPPQAREHWPQACQSSHRPSLQAKVEHASVPQLCSSFTLSSAVQDLPLPTGGSMTERRRLRCPPSQDLLHSVHWAQRPHSQSCEAQGGLCTQPSASKVMALQPRPPSRGGTNMERLRSLTPCPHEVEQPAHRVHCDTTQSAPSELWEQGISLQGAVSLVLSSQALPPRLAWPSTLRVR